MSRIALELFGSFDSVDEMEQEFAFIIQAFRQPPIQGESPNMGSHICDWDSYRTEIPSSWTVRKDFITRNQNSK